MYTYKLHKSNATPVLSSRAHLGAHKRAAPFRSMFSCKGEEGNIGMLVGEGGKEKEGGADFGVPLPQTAQIHWRRRNFTAGPWGSFMGSHRGF